MSGTTMRSRVRPAIRDALNEAYACRAIDAQQLRQLLEQLQELLRERVLRFNHGQSTSLLRQTGSVSVILWIICSRAAAGKKG